MLKKIITVQRVPALRGFWDLKKPRYVKFALVEVYGVPCRGENPPLAHCGSAICGSENCVSGDPL